MATGTIRKLVGDRGFGFLAQEDGTELFFHRSAVAGDAFDTLQEGQKVTYDKGHDPRGNRERAENVSVAS